MIKKYLTLELYNVHITEPIFLNNKCGYDYVVNTGKRPIEMPVTWERHATMSSDGENLLYFAKQF